MKQLTYLLLLACILLSSCTASRRAARKAPKPTTYTLPKPTGDTVHVTVTPPPRTVVGQAISKVTGRDKPSVTPAGNIILPKKNYGSISISTGSGSSSASVAGKKAAAAVGEGATTTSIDKVKAPTAVGDSNQLNTAGKKAVAGDGNTVTSDDGWKPWQIIAGIFLVAYAGWYIASGTIWGKMQVWLPSREKKVVVGIVFAAVAGGLIYYLS